MEKNQIFRITCNEIIIKAVVIDCLGIVEHEKVVDSEYWVEKYLCYGQNRLFYYIKHKVVNKVINNNWEPKNEYEIDYFYAIEHHSHDVEDIHYSIETIVEYCVIPAYDEILNYKEQL